MAGLERRSKGDYMSKKIMSKKAIIRQIPVQLDFQGLGFVCDKRSVVHIQGALRQVNPARKGRLVHKAVVAV